MNEEYLLSRFAVDERKLIKTSDGQVPLIYSPVTPNFGDLFSPWLLRKMTGYEIKAVDSKPLKSSRSFFRRIKGFFKQAKRPTQAT